MEKCLILCPSPDFANFIVQTLIFLDFRVANSPASLNKTKQTERANLYVESRFKKLSNRRVHLTAVFMLADFSAIYHFCCVILQRYWTDQLDAAFLFIPVSFYQRL